MRPGRESALLDAVHRERVARGGVGRALSCSAPWCWRLRFRPHGGVGSSVLRRDVVSQRSLIR